VRQSFPSVRRNDKEHTALMAVTAGESREKDMVANRREPAGTGAGGVISDTRPYGYGVSYPLVKRALTYSE